MQDIITLRLLFSKDAYSALSLYSTRTDFNNTESKNTFTFGLGYRGSVIYAGFGI
mgnify:CR=1 FL=1